MERLRVNEGKCPVCDSWNLCSWTNDRVVICEDCGANLGWSTHVFYYGNGNGSLNPNADKGLK